MFPESSILPHFIDFRALFTSTAGLHRTARNIHFQVANIGASVDILWYAGDTWGTLCLEAPAAPAAPPPPRPPGPVRRPASAGRRAGGVPMRWNVQLGVPAVVFLPHKKKTTLSSIRPIS